MNRNWTTDHREWYWDVYLKSDHWKQLRESKLKSAPSCEKCGAKHPLDVHHLNYRNLIDVTVSDLLTVCRKCHTEIHQAQGRQKRKRPSFREFPARIKRLLRRQEAEQHRVRIKAQCDQIDPGVRAEYWKKYSRKFKTCTEAKWKETRLG